MERGVWPNIHISEAGSHGPMAWMEKVTDYIGLSSFPGVITCCCLTVKDFANWCRGCLIIEKASCTDGTQVEWCLSDALCGRMRMAVNARFSQNGYSLWCQTQRDDRGDLWNR